MCIGPDDGCQEVPDPMAPIDMTLVSLEPTRIPISLFIITISGPMFMFIPLMFMPGICPMGLADGLAPGIGIFIPGILPVCFWFAEFFCAGVFFLLDADLRRCIGIFMPGMFIPGMLPMSCFFVVCLFPCT